MLNGKKIAQSGRKRDEVLDLCKDVIESNSIAKKYAHGEKNKTFYL